MSVDPISRGQPITPTTNKHIMRQFRVKRKIAYIVPKIKKVTDKAILFQLDNQKEEWIPKKWIMHYNKSKKIMYVNDYWKTEMYIKGFIRK